MQPPVKLKLKLEGIKPCQVELVHSSSPSAAVSGAASARLSDHYSVQMNSSALIKLCDSLPLNQPWLQSKGALASPPPERPDVILTGSELNPPTPCIFVRTPEEVYSPQLLDFCLQHPIVVVRNMAPACGLDLTLYSTKTLVETHPNHPVEIRTQIEQGPDENLDPSMSEPVWYCSSSRSQTTIAKYAEYQAGSLEEAWKGDAKSSLNPSIRFENGSVRRMIKFGTNCDLSDEKKWGPQLKELMKLPAWARVVSAGNMLSHIGHQILGMNTVQLYMKVPCSRTPGHQENNNFCAININIGPGDSEWFGVPYEYWGALQKLCQKNNVNYLHGSWWPQLSELRAAGIPYYRFMQRPGDLVWINVGCVHWVQAAGWCNNIAWNVGPLTFRQYAAAMERYEWNKSERYQSIVAMVHLTWNLARNLCISDDKLFSAMRWTMAKSLLLIMQTLRFVRDKGCDIKFHGRRKNDPVHYCGTCEEEVFDTLMIKGCEKRHVVHCLFCAVKEESQLKGWICLEEYVFSDLCKLYDDFQHSYHYRQASTAITA